MVKAPKMEWEKLLSQKRLMEKTPTDIDPSRRPFQKDFDRIVFLAPFRKLQDKTQVFPLAESDYVRTRLTHSLEASCVARSLGTYVGMKLHEQKKLPKEINPYDIGDILASATLAHDIGNPPLGHSGEDAVKEYFRNYLSDEICEELSLSTTEKADLMNFEGNAQGFRILTKLHMYKARGGLRLTNATLATYMKYPKLSDITIKDGKSFSKYGFFDSEKDFFKEIAEDVGLLKVPDEEYAWYRHPLAFLLEAADDICYTIIDFEDGIRLRHLNYQRAQKNLLKFFNGKTLASHKQTLKNLKETTDKVQFLRSVIIKQLVSEVSQLFMSKEKELLSGAFNEELVAHIPSSKQLTALKVIDQKSVYTAPEVLDIEAAGFEVIGGLLDLFIKAVNDANKNKPSKQSEKILQVLPRHFKNEGEAIDKNPYIRIQKIVDYISGMTDSYAVRLYKKLKGISLHSR